MLLDPPFDPQNSFRATFLTKGSLNLLDYYMFDGGKSKKRPD